MTTSKGLGISIKYGDQSREMELRVNPSADDIQFRLRLLQGHSWFQPRDCRQIIRTASAVAFVSSSAGRNVRPSSALTPSVAKRSAPIIALPPRSSLPGSIGETEKVGVQFFSVREGQAVSGAFVNFQLRAGNQSGGFAAGSFEWR